MSAVYLGCRCDSSVQRAVVKMLADERATIQFYGVWSKDDGFRLGRYAIDVDEILAQSARMSAKFAVDDFNVA